MRGRYLVQVGRHKPCEPEFGYVHMSPFGTVYCFASTVAVDAFGRHGATHDLAQRGVGRSGRESVMAIDRFFQNVVGPPNGSARPWVPLCGYSVLTSAECVLNLSIAAPVDKGPVHSWSHYGSTVIIIMCLITTLVR